MHSKRRTPDFGRQVMARNFGTDLDKIDLSANESPLGPAPGAIRAIIEGALRAHRYPDANGLALKAELAEILGVAAEQVVLGNGSCEVLDLTARAVLGKDDEAMIGWPSFPAYRSMVDRAGAKAVLVPLKDHAYDLDAMAEAVTGRTRLVVLGNPNNPTGLTFGQAAFTRFLERLPGEVVVIIDEAYHDYVGRADRANALDEIAGAHALVVTRSFSKAHGLAGLRLGYGVAPVRLARQIEAQRQRFNTSGIAQAAAMAALADHEHLARCVALNGAGRQWLENRLAALDLFFLPSEANFVMVRVGEGKAVHEHLRARGVLVKPLDAFGLPDYIRVSVGRPEENERFIQALIAVLPQTLPGEPACCTPI